MLNFDRLSPAPSPLNAEIELLMRLPNIIDEEVERGMLSRIQDDCLHQGKLMYIFRM